MVYIGRPNNPPMHRFYTALVSLTISTATFAQQATTSASGAGQAGNIILDWSLGELTLVNTVQNGNLQFTQGLHQGRLVAFAVFGGIGAGELVITPNPTSGLLTVQTGFLEPGELRLKLYDAGGKLLIQSSEALNAFSTKAINLLSYADGLYLLQAVFTPTSGSARKSTYKILRLP